MANIKLPNGDIKPDQRTNGARLKLCIGDWLKIICVVIGLVWGYAILTNTVFGNSKVLAQQVIETGANTVRSIYNERTIDLIQDDVKVIKQDVKDILKLVR